MTRSRNAGTGGRAGGRAPVRSPSGLVVVPDDRGGSAVRGGDVLRITGRSYVTREGEVPDAAIYRVEDLRPDTDGPWLREADKVAWLDATTGYECIVLRGRDGALGGYVGVPEAHPLHGWTRRAVVGLGFDVHGGISHAAACEDGSDHAAWSRRGDRGVDDLRAEAERICHVEGPVRGGDRRAWWFGFVCDGRHDLVPGDGGDARVPAGIGVDRVYRDDAYVIAEVRHLAAQLRAVADGEAMPSRGRPNSPVAGRLGKDRR